MSIVDICWVHTAVGSEFSQLWSTESGLLWCNLYCHHFFWALELWYGASALFITSSPGSFPLSARGSLLSEGYLIESHKLILLQTRSMMGSISLLSISLTVPPFVERFQHRDDPCRVGFYALPFLSFGFYKCVVHTSFWLSNIASLATYIFRHV